MSAGAFKISKYGASYGGGGAVHPIRIQPETESATIDGTANAAPTGEVGNPISAVVSRGGRALGLNARMVSLRSPATGQPTGYAANSVTRIPCLTTAFFDKCVKGSTCSYNGASYTVVGTSAEKVN